MQQRGIIKWHLAMIAVFRVRILVAVVAADTAAVDTNDVGATHFVGFVRLSYVDFAR